MPDKLEYASIPHEELARELAPVVVKLHERHLANAAQWYPHELAPWSLGSDYEPHEVWTPDQYPAADGVRSAIFVNLLTEDNLPYYTNTLSDLFGKEHPFNDWIGRWTAEENRHSTALRTWVDIRRPLDPWQLEDARMAQMTKGEVPKPPDPIQAIAYVSFQELATQVAHRNTARQLPSHDSHGRRIMGRIAGDEALHYRFYKDMGAAIFEIDPSAMMIAVARQLRSFAMPGTGIIDFKMHQTAIAEAGIYDVAKFKTNVVEPTLESWELWDRKGLSHDAQRALSSIDLRLRALGHAAGLG